MKIFINQKISEPHRGSWVFGENSENIFIDANVKHIFFLYLQIIGQQLLQQ